MPKCEVDVELHHEVKRFMSEYRLTRNAAATTLGVGRTTFWRFCDTGRAREDTKKVYREALAKCNKSTSTRVADDAVDADLPATQARPALAAALADRELKQIRRVCEGVLTLLDVYESQIVGQKNLKAFQSSN